MVILNSLYSDKDAFLSLKSVFTSAKSAYSDVMSFIAFYLGLHCLPGAPVSSITKAGLQISVHIGKLIFFSSKTYVVDTQKNRLNETVLMRTHNTC